MMKGIVKEGKSVIYKDKIYRENDHIEIDDAVGASLVKRGCIIEYSEAEMVKGKWDKEDLKTWKVAELKELAAELGIDATGKKEELIERICAVEVELPADEVITEEEFEEIQKASEEDHEEDGEGPATGMPE